MTKSKKNAPCISMCALASGSQGNAVYISDGDTSLLLDAGLSGVEIQRRLASIHVEPEEISAIVVSHEHGDHIKGVGIFSRRYKVPVYATEATAMASEAAWGKLHGHEIIETGKSFAIAGLSLHPFPVSHDAADPVGFTIRSNGLKVGSVTDLGVATAVVRRRLEGCAALLLESNHDEKMLEAGPYPWAIKQRVKSRHGHLSNEASRDLLAELVHDRLSHVILGHISETNNLPEIALKVVSSAVKGHGARISLGRQHACGDLVRVTET